MQKKVLYLVRMRRIDDSHVDLVETEDFSEAKKVWKDAYLGWAESVAERKPFVVDKPINNQPMIAFDPSLIREITLVPLEVGARTDNPFVNKMQRDGLSSMFNVETEGSLLDGGYK